MERYQSHAETDRWRSRHQTARGMSLQRISNSLRHDAVAWGETYPNLAETQGLGEFSNHLEDGNTRTERNWYKASEERKKEKGIQSPPLSFMEATQSPRPQSYIANSLILWAYPIALSKAALLLRTSLNRIASGDLARMRGGDLGDGDRVKMLILGDLEGGRGNEEYLLRLVNNPLFRLVSEEPSSRPDSFIRGYGPFSS